MPETLTGILLLTLVLYWALVYAARWLPASRWMIAPLVGVAIFSSLNALYYLHAWDALVAYYQYRTWVAADYVPALSGLCVGALMLRTSGTGWLIAKTLAVGLSLVVILVPWAKPLINPLSEASYQNVVHNGVISQTSASTCGPCAMAFTLSRLGCAASEGSLSDESFTSGSGTELWYLARCAQRRGFHVQYVFDSTALSPGSIIGISLGDTGHFVSVDTVVGEQVTLHDSMRGMRVLTRTTLVRQYRYSGLSLHISAGSAAEH